MKRENPNLFGALLLGLLLNTLLSSQTAYWARIGLLAYPLSAGLLISAALLFAWAWRGVERRRWLRFALGCLLGASSALEVLRFWRLLERVAPDSQNLLEVCLLLLLPVLYLRRVSAIAQTANVVLAALLIAGGLLILSIAGDLQVANLQRLRMTGNGCRRCAVNACCTRNFCCLRSGPIRKSGAPIP